MTEQAERSVDEIRLHLPGDITVGEAMRLAEDYQPITRDDRRLQSIALGLGGLLREHAKPGLLTEQKVAHNYEQSETFLKQPAVEFPADEAAAAPPEV